VFCSAEAGVKTTTIFELSKKYRKVHFISFLLIIHTTTNMESVAHREEEAKLNPKSKHYDYQTAEETTSERYLSSVLEIIRNYLLFKKLVGKISVNSSLLTWGKSVSCEVDGSSWSGRDSEKTKETMAANEEERNKIEQLISSWVKRAVDELEKRAFAYSDKSYKGSNLQLATNFTVNVPGLTSFSIDISCGIDSLITAAKSEGSETSSTAESKSRSSSSDEKLGDSVGLTGDKEEMPVMF